MEHRNLYQGLGTLTDAWSHVLLSVCLCGVCSLLLGPSPSLDVSNSHSHLAALLLGQKLGYMMGEGKGSCVPCPLSPTGVWPWPWGGLGSSTHLKVSQSGTRWWPYPSRLEAPWCSQWMAQQNPLPTLNPGIQS